MLTDIAVRQYGIFYIHQYPDPILNTPTKWVLDFDKVAKVIEPAKQFIGNDAIGLAAPQIGLLSRFFVWKINESEVQIAINPTVKEWSPESHLSTEGCLSFPGNQFEVRRANEVLVSYQNLKGEMITKEFNGLHAELFQHEIDHLDGITLPNNINLTAVHRV